MRARGSLARRLAELEAGRTDRVDWAEMAGRFGDEVDRWPDGSRLYERRGDDVELTAVSMDGRALTYVVVGVGSEVIL